MSTITGNIPLPTTSGASARRTRRRIVIFLLVSFLAFGAISVSAWFLVFGAVSISIHPGEDDKKREKPSEALKVPSQPPIGGEPTGREVPPEREIQHPEVTPQPRPPHNFTLMGVGN
jgi:hypothetical protein